MTREDMDLDDMFRQVTPVQKKEVLSILEETYQDQGVVISFVGEEQNFYP
ncbi:34004_t:CDS:2, partial [Racocetra persica]